MRYAAPATVAEATGLLAETGPDARILAGGTDLLVRMKAGQLRPGTVIDIKRIPELRTITPHDGGWRIGAAVPAAEITEHAGLKADWPGVVEAIGLIGSTQVQGRATPVGNLCNASPAADSVPALAAAGAVAEIAGPDGTRELPVEQVPTGPGKTALAPGEMITALRLPPRGERAGDAYLRFIPRTEMDIAVCGAAVSLTLAEDGSIAAARVALGAVAPTVILPEQAARALVGTRGDDAALQALAAACSAAARPIDDMRGTAEFRREVVGVLARRAALIALTRAGGAA